jgi:amino acid transporter
VTSNKKKKKAIERKKQWCWNATEKIWKATLAFYSMQCILIMVLNFNVYPDMWTAIMVKIANLPMIIYFFGCIAGVVHIISLDNEYRRLNKPVFDIHEVMPFIYFGAVTVIFIGVIVGEIFARDFEQDIENCSILISGQTPEQQVLELKTIKSQCLKK